MLLIAERRFPLECFCHFRFWIPSFLNKPTPGHFLFVDHLLFGQEFLLHMHVLIKNDSKTSLSHPSLSIPAATNPSVTSCLVFGSHHFKCNHSGTCNRPFFFLSQRCLTLASMPCKDRSCGQDQWTFLIYSIYIYILLIYWRLLQISAKWHIHAHLLSIFLLKPIGRRRGLRDRFPIRAWWCLGWGYLWGLGGTAWCCHWVRVDWLRGHFLRSLLAL